MSAPSRKQTSNQQRGGGGGQRGGGQRTRSNNGRGGPSSGRRGGGNPRSRDGSGGRRHNGNNNNSNNRNFNPNSSGNNNNSNSNSNNNNNAPTSATPTNVLGPIGGGRRDEEVLIAFMPYLKSDNPRAVQIHEQYQYSNDSKSFLKATREFLASAEATGGSPAINTHIDSPHAMATPSSPAAMRIPNSIIQPPSPASSAPGSILPPLSGSPFAHHPFAGISPSKPTSVAAVPPASMHSMMGTNNSSSYPNPSFAHPSIGIHPISSPSANPNLRLQQQSMSPFMHDASPFDLNSRTVLPTSPFPPPTRTTVGPPPSAEFAPRGRNDRQQNNIMASLEAQLDQLMAGDDEFQMQPQISSQNPISQPPTNNTQLNLNIASNFDKIHETSNNQNTMPVQHSIFSNFARQDSPSAAPVSQQHLQAPIAPPTYVNTSAQMVKSTPVNTPSRDQRNNTRSPRAQSQNTEQAIQSNQQSVTKTFKREPTQQRRVWTHVEDQPGRISVNDVHSASSVLDVRPRQELSAKWVLPWSYLQDRANELNGRSTSENKGSSQRGISDNPLTKLLPNLRLGLFRRGCAENGAQASIISKSVGLSPHMDGRSQTVTGTVPFYSPRTPGHVVFRLYWDDDPVYTLAMGPTLHVRVKEEDYEGTVRFLLSNLKKKVNPTSLSSLHSLALILETSLSSSSHGSSGMPINGLYERAGSATWGCICEARKVLDACAGEYYKTNQKLAKLSEVVEEMKQEEAKRQEEENVYDEQSDDNHAGGTSLEGENEDSAESNKESSENEQHTQLLREKTRALMSGRASCERKWRDSQLAFASILKAVVTNPSMSLLLRQDMIQKMRLEYELWCPLCEEFVIPGEQTSTDPPTMWYEPLKSFPKALTPEHVRICQDARASMQLKTLGFVPNTRPLHEILFQPSKSMDPGAVSVFNQLSAAMGHRYQEVFTPSLENRVNQQKEMLRAQVETLVQQCDGFPRGTKVAIFGSSANGFGTPSSDLDMCLQLPQGQKMDKDDSSGSVAMATLAKLMEEKSGMTEIDTGRLTARIPIIKFTCPIVTSSGEESEIECDLSMHNPLAVLNTSFLRTYSDIHPITRVLAFVIKRWAKARDINNPARHTLSSYGYIIMLLHFLTYHQRARTGLVVPVASPEGTHSQKDESPTPLLPNLLWMDHTWPESSSRSPYRELSERPKTPVAHPLEDVTVNSHFYRPKSQNEYQTLLRLFPGQDLSLAILLASFFRYYAFEFDYKRFVVSLHSTATRGLVEREVKAELDGWRHYSAALTIEDPFETFYDVAHVLRGGYYHRIRREFAVAYSKIVDAASGKQSVWNKSDLRAKSGVELLDWICEVVATDRDKEGTTATKQTASVANAASSSN